MFVVSFTYNSGWTSAITFILNKTCTVIIFFGRKNKKLVINNNVQNNMLQLLILFSKPNQQLKPINNNIHSNYKSNSNIKV